MDQGEGRLWRFDYRIFDEYVALAMAAGIDKAITIYTPVPWANRFRYLDEPSGNYVQESWAPESDMFRRVWHVFLDDLRRHLQQKGWLDRTYLGINENELSSTLTAIKVIKEHSQQWRITYAGDWHAELDGVLDDYSFVHGKEPTMEVVKARAAKGCSSTYYVCCTPPYPIRSCSHRPPKADGSDGMPWRTATTAFCDGPTTPGPQTP